MRIGELARTVNVNTSKIRFYEQIGILPAPSRTESGYRQYSEPDVARLRFVLDGQAVGLKLDEIGHLLRLRERGRSTCEHTVALLHQRVSDLEHQIEALQRMKRNLIGVLERAEELNAAECTDPVRCQVIATS